MTSVPRPSDAALEHLANLLIHRADLDELHVELYPTRCATCRELAEWAEKVRRAGQA
jgi:hypothetical protein